MAEIAPMPLVYESPYWRIVLNANQTYVGRSVVVLKRACGDLAEVTAEEWVDLRAVVQKTESVMRTVLGAAMFNWSCLMNHAYRETPPRPQVHWHVIPRYAVPVSIGDRMYSDPNFSERSLSETVTRTQTEIDTIASLLRDGFEAASL